MNTARRVFSFNLDGTLNSQGRIWAYPGLQNFDSTPNGIGADLADLQSEYLPSIPDKHIRLDYVPANWNDKEEGPWAFKNSRKGWEREMVLSNWLRQLMKDCPNRDFEIGLVTHGSIMCCFMEVEGYKSWRGTDPRVLSLAFDPERGYRELTEEEMFASRRRAFRKVCVVVK